MTPAGGSMEQQLDPKPLTAWDFLLSFLERVGVDVVTCCEADILIHANATEGTVKVAGYVKDEDGRPVVEGDHLKTWTATHEFFRAIGK